MKGSCYEGLDQPLKISELAKKKAKLEPSDPKLSQRSIRERKRVFLADQLSMIKRSQLSSGSIERKLCVGVVNFPASCRLLLRFLDPQCFHLMLVIRGCN